MIGFNIWLSSGLNEYWTYQKQLLILVLGANVVGLLLADEELVSTNKLLSPRVQVSNSFVELRVGLDRIDLLQTEKWSSNLLRKHGDTIFKVGIELSDPSINQVFEVSCGLKLQGSSSLYHSPKKNFKILFRKEHGLTRLRKNPFADLHPVPFRNLVLKSPTHDSWTVKQENWRRNARYVNDVWANETQRLMGHLTPRNRWIHLYLNERYWGIYRLGERPDEHFVSAHSGGKSEDYDAFNAGELKEGDEEAYRHCRTIVSSPRLNDPLVFSSLRDYLDLEGFIDYVLYNLYAVNVDWPKKNYWLAGKRSEEPRFRFFNWDAEIGFFERWDHPRNPKGHSALEFDQLGDVEFTRDQWGAGYLFNNLIRSEEFKILLADRMYRHLSEGGILSPTEAAKRYRKHLDEVEPMLVRESQRWGSSQREEPYSVDSKEWQDLAGEESWLFKEFFPKRSDDMIEDFRKKNLYPAIDPPAIEGDTEGQTVSFSGMSPGEVVYYTLSGADPRESWSGKPVGKLGRGPIQVPEGKVIQYRRFKDGVWSAKAEYSFGRLKGKMNGKK